jgi:hypothetical protein
LGVDGAGAVELAAVDAIASPSRVRRVVRSWAVLVPSSARALPKRGRPALRRTAVLLLGLPFTRSTSRA